MRIFLGIFLLFFSNNAFAQTIENEVEKIEKKIVEVEKSGSLTRHSVSIQFGVNGALQSDESFGLQLVPPDISYGYEFFDNNLFNFSTATFYDNIGVKVRDAEFTYRVGQRIDLAREFKNCCTPYITGGIATIRRGHHYQTGPVYGAGILFKIMKKFSLVNEVNMQRVFYQNSGYDILNASVGVVYDF